MNYVINVNIRYINGEFERNHRTKRNNYSDGQISNQISLYNNLKSSSLEIQIFKPNLKS